MYDDFEERSPGAAHELGIKLGRKKLSLRRRWSIVDWAISFWLVVSILFRVLEFPTSEDWSPGSSTAPTEISIHASGGYFLDDRRGFIFRRPWIFGPKLDQALANSIPFIFAIVIWIPLRGIRNLSTIFLDLEPFKGLKRPGRYCAC